MRSLLANAKRAEERATFDLMTHSRRDQEVFDRRRLRLAGKSWRAFNLTPEFTSRAA
ncbi:MAG: hypothetical protein AAGC99_17490 [Pseudomonadota bacterium]